MKKLCMALVVFIVICLNANGQLSIKINSKTVAEQQTLPLNDIKKVELGFANPKKIPAYSQGKVVLMAQVFSAASNKQLGSFYIVKNGAMAMSDFLGDANTVYLLYEEGGSNNAFTADVDWNDPRIFKDFLQNAAAIPDNKLVNVTVSLYYKDKIGYEKYGDPVELVKPLTFKVNTGTADGSIIIKGTSLKIPSATLTEIGYRDQMVDEMNTYKGLNPLLTDEKIYRCGLNKLSMSIHINIVDTKDLTADQKIADLQKGFGDFLRRISNACNPVVLEKLPQAIPDHWDKLVSYGNVQFGVPELDKKGNHDFDKEPVMKPWQQGNIQGLKFSSFFRSNYCELKPAERYLEGYAVIYFIKNPVNAQQVLIIWERSNDEKAPADILPKVENILEKFITTLKYN